MNVLAPFLQCEKHMAKDGTAAQTASLHLPHLTELTSFVRIISELQETLLETDALHTHVLHSVCVDTLEPQLILPRPTMIQFDPS